jgi:hypothetical protein
LTKPGNLLFQTVRYEPKDFKQRRPDGKGGYVWHLDCHKSGNCRCNPKLPPVRLVLYNLPEVMKANFVLIVEGEKDCQEAKKLGLVATCNPMGAGKWKSEYNESLRGKDLAVMCDADAPGMDHGRHAATSLAGIAGKIKFIEALHMAKDLSEWVEHGGTREQLLELVREAPVFTATRSSVPASVWQKARFVSAEEESVEANYLEEPIVEAGHVTEVAGPRGLGKSNYARWLASSGARASECFILTATILREKHDRRFVTGVVLKL